MSVPAAQSTEKATTYVVPLCSIKIVVNSSEKGVQAALWFQLMNTILPKQGLFPGGFLLQSASYK